MTTVPFGWLIRSLHSWSANLMVRFLRGGDRVTGGTLSRFYGWHVAILPAATTVLLVVHLVLVQIQGMSVPRGASGRRRDAGR